MALSSSLVLQILTTISVFCASQYDTRTQRRICYKKILTCVQKVEMVAQPTETYNCISKKVNNE